jgi:hypothetical protein
MWENNTRFVNVEPPVRRSRCPWKFSWTEFKFTRVEVKPVRVFINEMPREITKKCGPWDEL